MAASRPRSMGSSLCSVVKLGINLLIWVLRLGQTHRLRVAMDCPLFMEKVQLPQIQLWTFIVGVVPLKGRLPNVCRIQQGKRIGVSLDEVQSPKGASPECTNPQNTQARGIASGLLNRAVASWYKQVRRLQSYNHAIKSPRAEGAYLCRMSFYGIAFWPPLDL